MPHHRSRCGIDCRAGDTYSTTEPGARSLPFVQERYTPPQELVRHTQRAWARRNLPRVLERHTQRLVLVRHTEQELAQHNCPLELARRPPRQATVQRGPLGLEQHSSHQALEKCIPPQVPVRKSDRWCCVLHRCNVTGLGLLQHIKNAVAMRVDTCSDHGGSLCNVTHWFSRPQGCFQNNLWPLS